jgi:multidrug efflux system membrane fusion protein
MRGQSGQYAYVVKADKTVEMRPVTTGQSVDGFTAVLSGVTAGETVVVDGQARIAPGTPIEAKELPTTGVPTAGLPASALPAAGGTDPAHLAQRNGMS